MAICNCNVFLGGTKKSDCDLIGKAASTLIFVPYFKVDGSKNEIDLATDTLNEAYFEDKYNLAEPLNRWYPVHGFENIEDVRADGVFETFNSGTKSFVKQGERSFTGFIPSVGATYLSKLDKGRCQDWGAYVIDLDGNLMGASLEANKLRPIRVNKNSFYSFLDKATDTTVSKVTMSWDWHKNESDSNLRMIGAGDMGGADLLTLDGLLEAKGSAATAISTTGFTMSMTECFGSFGSENVFTGLTAAAFDLYNVTDSASVTISTLTELPDGTYAFTFAAETVSDVLELRQASSGSPLVFTTKGVELSDLLNYTITIV